MDRDYMIHSTQSTMQSKRGFPNVGISSLIVIILMILLYKMLPSFIALILVDYLKQMLVLLVYQ
jgi:hypothetical protein